MAREVVSKRASHVARGIDHQGGRLALLVAFDAALRREDALWATPSTISART